MRQSLFQMKNIFIFLLQLVGDAERPVIFYEWTAFLSKFYKKVPLLLSYHHFRCDSSNPSSVFVRKYSNEEEKEIKLLKPGINVCAESMPDITVNEGLDAARQWYLFDEIRPLCPSPLVEVVCPRPSVPKPGRVKEECKKKK